MVSEVAKHPWSADGARRRLEDARAEMRAGSLERAWQACREAADIGRTLGDPEIVAQAATAITDPIAASWQLTSDRQSLCLEALWMLGPQDPDEPPSRTRLRERVEARLASLSTRWAPAVQVPSERVDRDAAERRFEDLQTSYARVIGPAGIAERMRIADEAIQLGRAAAHDDVLAWGWHWRLDTAQQLGLRVDVDQALRELSAVVARLGSPQWQWRLAAIHANVALLEHRLDDVPGLARAAVELGREGNPQESALFDLILRSEVAERTGVGLADVEEEVRQATGEMPFFAQGWRAQLLLRLGRTEEATEIWRALAANLDGLPANVDEWLVVMEGHAVLAIGAGDAGNARRLHDELIPYGALHVSGPSIGPNGGPVALVLARLADFLGETDEARRWAAEALGRSEAMGAPWFAAQARAVRDRGPRRFPPLSPRESEVAQLVAEALTNREIAGRLFLSERTVEQHVRSILRRLDLPNRAAIVAWVGRSR